MKQIYKIPKYLTNKIVTDLDNNIIKTLYSNNLEKYLGKDFPEFIEDILTKYFCKDDVKKFKKTMNDKKKKKKYDWYKSAVTSFNSFTSADSGTIERKRKKEGIFYELASADAMLNLYGADKFKEIYNVTEPSVNGLIEKRLVELKDWYDSKETKIIDYMYIKEKSSKQLEKALTIDTILFISDMIINQFNGSIKGLIIERPDCLINNAIFADGWGKLKVEDNSIEIKKEKLYYNDYETPSSGTVRTLIKEENMKSKEIADKIATLFDSVDGRIYDCLMSKRNINFIKDRKIFINEAELVNSVFKSDGRDNYASIENHLKKWASTRFCFIKGSKSTLIWGLLDYLKIEERPDIGGRQIEVTVSELIQQEHINKQVIRLYKDKLNKFSLNIATELLFIMQKERFFKYTQNKTQNNDCKSLIGIYDYDFFANRIRFRSKSREKNLKILKECLDDFVKNEVTVSSYTPLKDDEFEITFYNILDYELEDLLTFSDSDTSSLIKQIQSPN